MQRTSLLTIILSLPLLVAYADDPTAERDAHRQKSKQVAESFQITSDDQPVQVATEPLLRYTDATRRIHESSLWVWGLKGRPAAIMAIEYYPKQPKGTPWLFEIVSLSPHRIHAHKKTYLDWHAEKPGLNLTVLPDSGTPADRPALRLAQMRQLMRRFTAHESAVIEGRVELRPMTNALHRYEDGKANLIDGALFAFANGTNPEVFVLLEAHSVPGGSPVWKYSLAQMTGGAVSVSLDGNEVWSSPEADPPAIRPSYVNGWLRSE